ncbi:MAG: dCTP deaminase [Candidatus Thermoplasmatota archaeon]|nr:dCTP deaminase [Candidatus Thermoplasmatota archaeon]
MQLSDADVRVWMMDGKLQIKGFRDGNLTPNGYDLTIAELALPDADTSKTEGSLEIPPKTRFLVSTEEEVHLGPRVAGDLWLRTTWARQGVLPAFGKVDAGFEGTLTLLAYNASERPLEIAVGDTFAQITFHEVRSLPEATYAESSGTYQGQSGVTPARSPDRKRSGPG